MADGPKFGMYVRSVKGRIVQRYGSAELLGATRRVLTKTQKLDDESPIVWSDSIVPLSLAFCRRYARELADNIRLGDLESCKAEDWEKQCAADQKRIDEDNKRAADEAKKGKEE